MTLRPAVVLERLAKMRQILRNLVEIRDVPRREFVGSFRHHWLAERGLQLAAETIFDIGSHILAGHLNVHPSDYEDVLNRLGEQGVISEPLRDRLRGLGGFRNILVHAYMEIDVDRVYDSLHNELGAFGSFADEIEAFLEDLSS